MTRATLVTSRLGDGGAARYSEAHLAQAEDTATGLPQEMRVATIAVVPGWEYTGQLTAALAGAAHMAVTPVEPGTGCGPGLVTAAVDDCRAGDWWDRNHGHVSSCMRLSVS